MIFSTLQILQLFAHCFRLLRLKPDIIGSGSFGGVIRVW